MVGSIQSSGSKTPIFQIIQKYNIKPQPTEYKNHVLGNGIRIGIEASNGFGWEKYLGSDGLFFGVNSFGVSCPGKEAFKYFGLTAKDIFDKITDLF